MDDLEQENEKQIKCTTNAQCQLAFNASIKQEDQHLGEYRTGWNCA